ncbi:zinc finger protein Xfin-like isoform X2 [Trichoplusia ni]|uniref:Zinc finger protein Xfin-like isoform X2 n=1 Tax=Trichoplusia ni TaxID=7111 RepID=A0A7E5X5M2_TRINI|nr:zinc finger protein Xfin-like isoform X2 [Trichoplusia ni]
MQKKAKHQRISNNFSGSIGIKQEPTTSRCPITEMYATKQFSNKIPMMHVSEPPMQINVKVEVERFDEAETDKDKRIYVDEGAFRRRFKNKKFVLTNNMVVSAADKIKQNSKNIADHILDIAVRNTSGHILRRDFYKINPWDERIQKALDEWKEWQSKHFLRDGPLFYKCYHCLVSFWYLEDFKRHLSGHKYLNVGLESHTHHEVNIIAYEDPVPSRMVLPTKGNCGRCGKNFKDHSLSTADQLYTCHGCSKVFHTCLNLGFHVSNCPTLGLPKTRITCQICKLEIPSINNMEHLHNVHMVRSDVPILTRHCIYSTCDQCTERYINKDLHICFIRSHHQCNLCFRSFPTEYLVKRHAELYKEPYECPICGLKMRDACNKYEHMMAFHSDNYTLAIKCTMCVRLSIFLTNGGLAKHLRCAHRRQDTTYPGFAIQIIIPKSCLHPYFDAYSSDKVDISYAGRPGVTELSTAQTEREDVQVKNEIESDVEQKEEVIDDVVEIADSPEIEVKDEPEESSDYQELTIKEEPILPEIVDTEYFAPDVSVKEEFDEDIDVYEDDIIKLDINMDSYQIKEENADTDSQESSNDADYQEEAENDENIQTTQVKLYRCTKCGYEDIHKNYRKHIASSCSKTFATEYKITCRKCSKSFRTFGKYLIHLKSHGYRALTCPECLMQTNTCSKLVSHVHAHIKQSFIKIKAFKEDGTDGKAEYQCSKCSETVDSQEVFVHWEKHVNFGPRSQELSSSRNDEFGEPTVVDLLARLQQRTKQCCYCDRIFVRFNECKRHQIEHLLTDAYEYKDQYRELRCQICAAGFKKPELYRQHMRDHAALPVYRCDICNKSFSDSSNFTKHKKVHNFKVFVCDLCKKKFQSKNGLIKHMEMHMNTEPIACEHCDKVFHFESAYRRHMKYQHNKGLKGYPCIVCNIKFDALKHKWRHMWEVHRERKIAADCPVCHKSFRIYSEVRRHMKTEHFTKLSVGKLRHEVRL